MAATWEELEQKYSGGKVASASSDNDPWSALEQKYAVPAAGARMPEPEKAPDPTEGNSFSKNALIGIGKGMTDLALGTKQRLDDAAAYLENKLGGQSVNAFLGLKNAADIQKATQVEVDEKRALDAPVMRTAGGKVGAIGANVIPAMAASLVPGGQTLAGSMVGGAVLGAMEPTATGESVTRNMAFGAGGAGVGYGAGKMVGKTVDTLAVRAQAKAAANSLKDANTAAAREAGYVFPPSQSNPNSLTANTLDILAGGRPKMAQAASLKNQGTTNRLAAKALGLPENTPLTGDVLEQVRKAAYSQGYAPIASAGKITPGAAYTQALDDIVSTTKGASNSFPGAVKNDIPDLIDGLRVKEFNAGDALKMTQVLRDQADAAYRAGNNMLGKANKQAANALEDAIENHLASNGVTDALKTFRDARRLMAKTYTVQKAINSETGDVSARVIAGELKKGKPLTDELLAIGKMGQLSPKNVQSMGYATPGASQLETFGSAGAALGTGNPLMLGIPFARAGLRDALLSKPVQRMTPAPSYGMFQNVAPDMAQRLPGLLSVPGMVAGQGLLPGLLNVSE